MNNRALSYQLPLLKHWLNHPTLVGTRAHHKFKLSWECPEGRFFSKGEVVLWGHHLNKELAY